MDMKHFNIRLCLAPTLYCTAEDKAAQDISGECNACAYVGGLLSVVHIRRTLGTFKVRY